VSASRAPSEHPERTSTPVMTKECIRWHVDMVGRACARS
jgi:hypothetical protein